MFTSITAKAVAAGLLAVALVGVSVTGASAKAVVGTDAGQSYEALYLWDGIEGAETLIADNTRTLTWSEPVFGYPKGTDYALYDTYFKGPDTAMAVSVFLSNRGEETDTSKWISRGPNGFADREAKTVLTPKLTPEDTAGTALATAKSNGGNFSLGIAYTDPTGVTVQAATFAHIVIKPGGDYTYEATVAGSTPEEPVGDSEEIGLEAGVIAEPATDGPLELSVPANAKATFGTATLVDGRSTSTAQLPAVTVNDQRLASKPGWSLTQTVADFTNGSATIDKKYLGVAPKVTSTGTGAAAASAQVADSAVYPSAFASAAAGSGTGVTTLGADLTLKAPADAAAGTYTSKMTLTLVSE